MPHLLPTRCLFITFNLWQQWCNSIPCIRQWSKSQPSTVFWPAALFYSPSHGELGAKVKVRILWHFHFRGRCLYFNPDGWVLNFPWCQTVTDRGGSWLEELLMMFRVKHKGTMQKKKKKTRGQCREVKVRLGVMGVSSHPVSFAFVLSVCFFEP